MAGGLIPSAFVGLAALITAAAGVPIAPYALGAAAVVLAVSAVSLPAARYRNWSYELRPDELVLCFGVVVRVERWVPRLRIQHVDLIGGPIERSLGLRQLVIYTAGTREADVRIPGLREPDAENLRAELLGWTSVVSVEEDESPPHLEPLTGWSDAE